MRSFSKKLSKRDRERNLTSPAGTEQRKLYLGLDVNTKSTGFVVCNDGGVPVECGLIDTTAAKSVNEFGCMVRERLLELQERYADAFVTVGVENFVQKYRNASSSSHTLMTLASVNTIASYECYNIFCRMEPVRVNVISARSFFGLSGRKGADAKKAVFDLFRDAMERTGYEVLLSSRSRAVHATNYDVSDAVLTGVYTYVVSNVEEHTCNEQEVRDYVDNLWRKSTTRQRESWMKKMLEEQEKAREKKKKTSDATNFDDQSIVEQLLQYETTRAIMLSKMDQELKKDMYGELCERLGIEKLKK